MAAAVDTMRDLSATRNMADDLVRVDEELHYWGRLKRADKPPNGWYTENTVERAIRGPRSTGPAVVPDRFMAVDGAVAKCTELEQRVLLIYYVRYPGSTKRFMRGRLNMSEGKWDRTLRAARNTVAGWI